MKSDFQKTAKFIGQRIAMLRKEKDVSLRELEKRTGISNGNLSAIEHGKKNVTLATLVRIAEAIGCHINIRRGTTKHPH